MLNGLCPVGLNIRKKPFILLQTGDLKVFWSEIIKKTQENLLEALCIQIVYYQRKDIGKVLLHEKTAGIRRFERRIGKDDCPF